MSEIPTDVMATAKTVFDNLLCPGDEACDTNVPHDIETIARAIMNERERCAMVVKNWQANLQTGELIQNAIYDLAGRIRRGEP